jgi:hypothetical protein
MKELQEIQKSIEALRIKVYAGQSAEKNEKSLYDIEQLVFKAMDSVKENDFIDGVSKSFYCMSDPKDGGVERCDKQCKGCKNINV